MPLSSKHLREYAELHAERASGSTMYKLLFGGNARRERVNPQDYILAPLLSILQTATLYSVTQALSLLL